MSTVQIQQKCTEQQCSYIQCIDFSYVARDLVKYFLFRCSTTATVEWLSESQLLQTLLNVHSVSDSELVSPLSPHCCESAWVLSLSVCCRLS